MILHSVSEDNNQRFCFLWTGLLQLTPLWRKPKITLLSLPLAGGITSPQFSLLLHWLPLCLRIDFKILLITFKACLSLALSYFNETLTRASIEIVVFKKRKKRVKFQFWLNYPSQTSPATCGTFFVQLCL